jgi:hypothetical protein
MTAEVQFSVEGVPCSGRTCTVTHAGAHTVVATRGGVHGIARLRVVPATLDHLVLTPASVTIRSEQRQAYQADGYDRFGNRIGDLTASAVLAISPDGRCKANVCRAANRGIHTVTARVGDASGTAVLRARG